MPIKLFITIDTEEDLWDKYQNVDNPVNNIERIPILQDLFDRFGAIPTYFINYPVVTNQRARHILKKIFIDGHCEIGTHCHPWNTPPFDETINKQNSMLCNLPYDLVHKKLETLHNTIVDLMGINPICFRAGRWGFGTYCAKVIYILGYRVDSSVTPFMNWNNHFGPDFSDAPTSIYRFDVEEILSENSEGSLLEVPPTVGFLQKNFRRCGQLRHLIIKTQLSRLHLFAILDRLRLLNRRWLSPELSTES